MLVVDDEPEALRQIQPMIRNLASRIETASCGAGAIARVMGRPLPDLVLLDMGMPEMDGLETLKRLRKLQPGLRVVMLAADNDPQKVVRSVWLGAQDCLKKPCDRTLLARLLREIPALADQEDQPAAPIETEESLGDGTAFVAASPAMRKLRTLVGEIAPTEIPVLCIGESGTGKEVVARLIHQLSRRSRHNFLKVNCAALPSELLESELFGYEQGAFTGAVRPKPGKFELCTKGTIFLDEIVELPLHLQAKLLHVLQDGEFTRLGGRSRMKVDVRVVAATNVDVRAALAAKTLREDLYYRLSTVVFELPPLRVRREEIPVLLRHFLEKHGGKNGLPVRPASARVAEFVQSCDWPGNVRELENFVRRYLALGEHALTPGNGNHRDQAGGGNGKLGFKASVLNAKADAESSAITSALNQTHWNRKAAAALLGISYKTLLEKMRAYSQGGPNGRQVDSAEAR